MSQENIEQLLLKGAELPNNANLNAIYKALEQNPECVKDLKDALNLMFESFDHETLNITLANFIIAVCAFPIENTPKLRLLMTAAIKQLLPPYLDRPAVLKALGLRDANLPPSNIIGRFRKLSALKNGHPAVRTLPSWHPVPLRIRTTSMRPRPSGVYACRCRSHVFLCTHR